MGRGEADKRAMAEAPGAGPDPGLPRRAGARLGLWLVGGTIAAAVDGTRRAGRREPGLRRRTARASRATTRSTSSTSTCRGARRATASRPGTVPGTQVAVVADTPAGRLGLSVCYDMRFPELYRAMAARAPTLLVVPAAFTVPTGRGALGGAAARAGDREPLLRRGAGAVGQPRERPRDLRRQHDRRLLGQRCLTRLRARRGLRHSRHRSGAPGGGARALSRARPPRPAERCMHCDRSCHRPRTGRRADRSHWRSPRPRSSRPPGSTNAALERMLGHWCMGHARRLCRPVLPALARGVLGAGGRHRQGRQRQHRAGRRRARDHRREDRLRLFRRDPAAGARGGLARRARHRAQAPAAARCRPGATRRGHHLYLPIDPLATLGRRRQGRAGSSASTRDARASIRASCRSWQRRRGARGHAGRHQRRHARGRRAAAGALQRLGHRRAGRPARAGLRAAAAGASLDELVAGDRPLDLGARGGAPGAGEPRGGAGAGRHA